MKKAKQERLKAAGWAVGDAQDFLELTDDEAALVDLKISLAESVRERRRRKRLSQNQVAEIMGSSQSRVAKMEAADPSVSLDLLVRTLLRLGATRQDLAKIMTPGQRKASAV